MERFTVEQDGFFGFLHLPEWHVEAYSGKALIVLGGSEGNENIPRNLGARFAREGIAALGLCYWNVPGLPDELIEVPIEPIERAVAYLRQRGFDRVGIYGISKGGELALLAASLMPQITCVVAISPLACAMPGITGNKSLAGKGLSDRSSWTWRGKPVPCARGGGRLPYLGIIRRIVTERQFDMRFVYERIVERAPKEAWIAVERINGPVLLASPSHDAMWPSDEACRIVEQRLAKHAHPFEITRCSYEYASHILVPMETPSLKLFRVERAHPEACRQSREDAFTQTLAFLARW